jgi:quinol monooxygenase YgiN
VSAARVVRADAYIGNRGFTAHQRDARYSADDLLSADLEEIMIARHLLSIVLVALTSSCAGPRPSVGTPVVRIAELEIDPQHLDAYTAAVREEMETSIRMEPGVLAIYAVAEKDAPTRLRFFEMYADEAAYRAHIASPHFRKYVETTKTMITSRRLIETVPVQLSSKR